MLGVLVESQCKLILRNVKRNHANFHQIGHGLAFAYWTLHIDVPVTFEMHCNIANVSNLFATAAILALTD